MPVILRDRGFHFLFYSKEGSPREPRHIHVRRGRDEPKFWLTPKLVWRTTTAWMRGRSTSLESSWRSIGTCLEGLGMNTSPRAVRFDDDCLWVELDDGRTIGVPLAWFPRLLHATSFEREAYELSRRGIQWASLDEDVSIAGLLSGQGDLTRAPGANA